MRKVIIILMIAGAGLLAGCQDYFLQKPDTTGTYDLPTIYSSRENAFTILVNLYSGSLRHGWPGSTGVNHGVLGELSGERSRGYNWEGSYEITSYGLSPIYKEYYVNNGADNYQDGYRKIRACWLLIENVDAVPDMDQAEKDLWKAEAYGLIAFRYMGMFYRYGGVPKVEKAFDPAAGENMNLPRMTLQETLDYTLELLQKAYDGLPTGDRPAAEKGRLTRGAVLAMKARLLIFAARPLFNSATPYRALSGNNNLISFGEEDPNRWTEARDANIEVLTWANSNGYRLLKQAAEGVANTFEQAVTDYGNATSQPSNPEALLQLKQDSWDNTLFVNLHGSASLVGGYSGDGYVNDLNGILTNMLEKYWMADGSDTSWPKVGEPARKGTDWDTRVLNLEARCRVDWLLPATGDHIAHPGNLQFSNTGVGKGLGNTGTTDNYPAAYKYGEGPRAIKFFAFRSVAWTELPIFRLAETYLNLAEAYNELGDETNALKYLNEIHLRAGLPALSAAGKDNIRQLIQRERAVELQGENHRYFDAKHWKIADIADGGLAGPMRELQFYVKSNWQNSAGMINTYWDAVTFNSFWADYMYLEPFPLDEVNKGAIIQNPGY
jgi:hypothetical protein